MSRWSQVAELGIVGASLSNTGTGVSYLHRRELNSFLDFVADALRRAIGLLRVLDIDRRPLADEDARSHFDSSGDEGSAAPDTKRHDPTLAERHQSAAQFPDTNAGVTECWLIQVQLAFWMSARHAVSQIILPPQPEVPVFMSSHV